MINFSDFARLRLAARSSRPPTLRGDARAPRIRHGRAPRALIAAASAGVAVLATFVAHADEVDRSAPPVVVPPTAFEHPGAEVHTVGGSTVWFVREPGIRKLQIHVILDRGAIDLDGKSSTGTEATGWLWDAATASQTADQVTETEELYDLDVSSWLGNTTSGLDLEVPPEELDRGLGLLTEMLREPTFPKDEVKRWAREKMQWYTADALTSPRDLASAALTFAWFPADHPFGVRPDLKAIKTTRSTALLERQARLVAEAPALVVVVGDIEWSALEPKLTAALGDLGKPGERTKDPAFTPPSKDRWLAVDMPGNPQATIRMRTSAPLRDDPDRVVAEVVDFAIGGSFLSRLNSNLREEKGWTYGAWSSYSYDLTRAHWTFGLDVKAENVVGTVTELAKEVDKIAAEGARADEITGARNTMVSWWNSSLETGEGSIKFYDQLHFDASNLGSERDRVLALDHVTPDDTKRVAGKWLAPTNPRVWVIVADKAVVGPQLETSGLNVEWVTAEDAILGTF